MARPPLHHGIRRALAKTQAAHREFSDVRRRMAERRLGLPLTDEAAARQVRDQIAELERQFELEQDG